MPPGPDRHALGAAAEDAALAHLRAAGLRLIERNARFKAGEIDLVMQAGDTLVFVEVRLRRHGGFGDGFDSVDPRKRIRLVRAAQCWLLRHPALAEAPCRFDVVSVHAAGLEWIPDAFAAPDG